jgi:transposase-like protein
MIRYTEDKKASVVADAERYGVNHAAKKHKVSTQAVYIWRKAANSNGSAVSGTGKFAACSSLADPIPEPPPVDEKLRTARDIFLQTQIESSKASKDKPIAIIDRLERLLRQTEILLSLREQEIAILRERLGEGKPQ